MSSSALVKKPRLSKKERREQERQRREALAQRKRAIVRISTSRGWTPADQEQWYEHVCNVYRRAGSCRVAGKELGISKQRVWQIIRALIPNEMKPIGRTVQEYGT